MTFTDGNEDTYIGEISFINHNDTNWASLDGTYFDIHVTPIASS